MTVWSRPGFEKPPTRLRPALIPVTLGCLLIGALTLSTLSLPLAAASTALGGLMIAGADIDARHYVLPDTITAATLILGLLTALLFAPFDGWTELGLAATRAAGTAAALAALRWVYGRLRGVEGLGLGDVKLAAGIGALLPLWAIPLCLAIASMAALVSVLFVCRRGIAVDRNLKIPFGAYLCPALWTVHYGTLLSH